MKNYIKTIFIILITIVLVLQSCENKKIEHQNPQVEKKHESKQNKDLAEEWLKSIFKCKNSVGFCYYVDKEDKICTARFKHFLIDSNEIYGASNLTEEEFPEAEKKYKEKWKKIYPLNSNEMWLFGRGNDDAENIKNLEIRKISNLKYDVFIDYGEDVKTQNEVTLISENNTFKIDYCKTKYLK